MIVIVYAAVSPPSGLVNLRTNEYVLIVGCPTDTDGNVVVIKPNALVIGKTGPSCVDVIVKAVLLSIVLI